MPTIHDIETSADRYSIAKSDVTDLVEEITARVDELKKEFAPRVKAAMRIAATRHEDLYRLIADNPDLFKKPRTYLFAGLKVGMQTGPATIETDDESLTIELIEKHLTQEQQKLLVKTTKKLNVVAVKKLDEKTLRVIRASLVEGKDHVVIKETDTQFEKIFSSIVKDQVEELQEEYSENGQD